MSASNASSSAPLSDTDARALYTFGLDLTQDALGVIFETIFLSVYSVFFALAIYSIFRKGVQSLTSMVMLCIVVYLYATSLTLWTLNVTQWFLIAKSLLDGSNTPLLDRPAIANGKVEGLGVPEEALFMFNMIVGDTVVIWRVWVLYQHKRWVVGIPCLMLVMSLVFTIIDLTCLTGAGWSNQSAIAGGGAVCEHAELISWAFSLVTNASCTVLIGFKAWQHRRMMRALHVQKMNSRRLSADKVLSVLVESGFVYCLFWLTQLVLFFPTSRFNATVYFFEIFGAMGDQISGLYPTLIIVIVNFHQTIWEGSESYSSATINSSTGRNRVSARGRGDAVSTVQWASRFGKASGTTATDTLAGNGMSTDYDPMNIQLDRFDSGGATSGEENVLGTRAMKTEEV